MVASNDDGNLWIAEGEDGDEKSAKTATQRGRKDKVKLLDAGAEPVNLLDTRTSRQVRPARRMKQ